MKNKPLNQKEIVKQIALLRYELDLKQHYSDMGSYCFGLYQEINALQNLLNNYPF